jgi:hypothetical protein
MPDHITLARNHSVVLIDCLIKAAELGERAGNLDLVAMAQYFADLIIEKCCEEETPMCESSFQLPADYVSTAEQARAQGVLTVYEAAKLLDMLVLDLVDEARAGGIEITARFNKVPCFSIQAVDADKNRRNAPNARAS